jgi:hypothetical protein
LEYFVLREYNIHKYLHHDLYNSPFAHCHRDNDLIETLLPFRIIITGLARNIAPRIEKNIRNCTLLGSYFKDYKIIVFENDSTDETRSIIKRLSETDENIHLIDSIVFPDCKLNFPHLYHYGVVDRQRISKMAFYRNVCNHFIFKLFSDYDFVMVLDMDIEGDIPIFPVLESAIWLDKSEEYVAVSANGRSPIPGTLGNMDTMYDAMAFCETLRDVEEAKYDNHKSFFSVILKYFRMMFFSHRHGHTRYARVMSAFNGLCLYKLKKVMGLDYNDEFICEHISLHQQMAERGMRMAIDLHLRICVGHQGPKRLIDFV